MTKRNGITAAGNWIIDRVKRERYVKEATIAVNLQNGTFSRQSDGRYALAKK